MKIMFPQKLCLFGELWRFRLSQKLRANISHNPALKSRKKDETEPSYELLSEHARIMVMNDVSARRRCCAEAQARGVRGGGSPREKIYDFCETVVNHGARVRIYCTLVPDREAGEQEPLSNLRTLSPINM